LQDDGIALSSLQFPAGQTINKSPLKSQCIFGRNRLNRARSVANIDHTDASLYEFNYDAVNIHAV